MDMEKNTDVFDFGFWWGKIFYPASVMHDFMAYINDKEAILYHIKNSRIIMSVDNENEFIKVASEETKKTFAYELHNDFRSESIRYQNSMIVFQFAVFEQILEESVYLFLINNNELLKKVEQINPNFRISNFFSLENIKSTEYTKDIIKFLCRKASNYVITGRIEKSFDRLEKMAGLKYSKKTINFIQEFQDKRNIAVHDSTLLDIKADYFDKILMIIEEYLVKLEKRFEEFHIPFIRQFDWNNI